MVHQLDVIEALTEFQRSIRLNEPMSFGIVHRDLCTRTDLLDDGLHRVAFSIVEDKLVKALAIFKMTGTVESPVGVAPAFSMWCAVPEGYRGRDLGKRLIEESLDELMHGFSQIGIKQVCINTSVDALDGAANYLASRVISDHPESRPADDSGKAMLTYTRLLTAA